MTSTPINVPFRDVYWLSDVPVPTDFGVNYEDLNLHTPDGIVLRSYLLRQRKDLGNHHAGKVDFDDDETDEEVSGTPYVRLCVRLAQNLGSSLRHDRLF